MHSLSNTTGSNSSSPFDSETECVENFTNGGWDDDLSDSKFEVCVKNKKFDPKLIKLANERFSLAKVFSGYQISIKQQQYSPSGWSQRILCPFPDHNDQTPSFCYNFQEDAFNCFGCQRGGKIVQFIAYMENKPQTDVAYKLLKDTLADEEDFLPEAQNDREYDKILEILLNYAKYLSDFIEKHDNKLVAIKYAESVTWSLDCYIRNHLPNGSIVLEQLIGRVELLKKYFEEWKL